MSKKMKQIMKNYRDGSLIVEDKNLKFKFRSTQPSEYEVEPDKDFDKDGTADHFDDVPFDPRWANIGTDKDERASFLNTINPTNLQTDFNKLMRQYYVDKFNIDPTNPSKPLVSPDEAPEPSNQEEEPTPSIERDPLEEVIIDSKKSVFNDIKQSSPLVDDDPNNNKVTVGEFINWMQLRDLDKSEVEVFYDKTLAKLKKYAKNTSSPTGKVASRILRVYGDINLRGLIGEVIGSVGGKTGLDALQAAFRESLDFYLDNAGFPKLLRSASAWLIAAIIFGFIKQFITDGAEIAIDKAITYFSDKSGDLHRGSMTPDIKRMFDVPDEILDMLDNAPQKEKGDSRRVIRTFMADYSEKLKMKLEKIKQELNKASDSDKSSIWNRELKIDDQAGEDRFAKEALLVIKKAYNLKKLAVTLDIGNKEKTITVENKQRIKIRRSKNVKR